jgi:uncharacterized protein YdaL
VVSSSLLVAGTFSAVRPHGQPGVDLRGTHWPAGAVAGPPAPAVTGSALVLYDGSGPYAPLAKVYATMAANLASHFAQPTVLDVAHYQAGSLKRNRAAIYVGVNEGEALPSAFLRDADQATTPVLWLGANVGELQPTPLAFAQRFGWMWRTGDDGPYTTVTYKGQELSRDPSDAGPLDRISIVDPGAARVLAAAGGTSGSTPWAVRSRNLTYVAEVPVDSGGTSNDRYLALSDLMFDVFGSSAPVRHRALLRIEDVGPNSDPIELQRVASYLSQRGIPYSFALYPVYVDPVDSKPRRTISLSERPALVRVVAFMLTHGGTMVLHGDTHQFGDLKNPLTGASAADFEFFRVHTGPDGVLVYDGPVPGDSTAWARGRMQSAIDEVTRTGLPRPKIFEFPHYGASIADYQAAQELFDARYDRAQYFSTAWHGGPMSPYMFEQYEPYVVSDVYGSKVIPENLGYVEGPPVPASGAGSLQAIVAGARANLVVRDGLGSFFFHPYLGVDRLRYLVDQLQSLGYRFTAPASL